MSVLPYHLISLNSSVSDTLCKHFSDMASSSTFVFELLVIFSILVLQPVTADPLGNLLPPIFSPILDDACKEVECGKGTCKPSSNSTFFFECECDPGWKQTSSNHTDHFKFLPCVIPNCNLDFSCTKAPAPISDNASKANESSIFNPCFWSYCGGGSCNKTSKFTYSCECADGYSNLLNVTTFPCFEECAIGLNCANLGISMSNKSTASPPALSGSGKNQASSMVQVNSAAFVILLMFAAMIHWK